MSSNGGHWSPQLWQVSYHAALSETDREKMQQRITDAEREIRRRMDELRNANDDHIEEDLVLDDALYTLQGLRSSLARSDAA